jgi:hypothetical protein
LVFLVIYFPQSPIARRLPIRATCLAHLILLELIMLCGSIVTTGRGGGPPAM